MMRGGGAEEEMRKNEIKGEGRRDEEVQRKSGGREEEERRRRGGREEGGRDEKRGRKNVLWRGGEVQGREKLPWRSTWRGKLRGGEAGGGAEGNDAAPYADDDDDASSAPEASLRGCVSKTAHRSCLTTWLKQHQKTCFNENK